ncbi:MAG: hypothetical protein EHM64_08795 [Ignavibacteriae bacterium]|nr:MAG: hypothetical protein EHM64_08795 [Ignavibacteriota bacterium]
MEFIIGVIAILCLAVLFEYRIRKPDFIVLCETKDGLGVRSGRFYPRHFSLLLQRTTHSFQLTVDATAKGNIDIKVKLAATVVASKGHLTELIRVGGWSTDAVARAAKELETVLQGSVKSFTEQFEIEELSSRKIRDHLLNEVPASKAALGVEAISLTILSFEPVNVQISEALKQQEQARILEQTEVLNQKARIASTKVKLKADEEIAQLENQLEMKKYDLKKSQWEREAQLNDLRINDELKRNRKRLEFDKEELDMLKSSPELLMLTPQAARLAEASQGLKNARTVVSLSPQDMAHGSELFGMFQNILQNALDSYRSIKEKRQAK